MTTITDAALLWSGLSWFSLYAVMDHLSQMTDADVETASGSSSYFFAAVTMAAAAEVSSKNLHRKRRPYLGRLFIMLSSSLFPGIPTIVFSFFVLFTVHTFFSLHFLFPQAFLIHFKTFISTQDQSSHISIFLQVFSYYLILTFKIRHIVNKKRLWKMNLFLFMTTVYKIRK